MAIRKGKYLVIGIYDSERNSWIPDGDIRHAISTHRTLAAAHAAADRAHGDLGGCDGSNSLTEVCRRLTKTEAKHLLAEADDDNQPDIYEHDGTPYLVLSCWDGATIGHDGLGFTLNY